MTQQSPIFARIQAFMVWLFEHTQKFPRHERFRLAQRIDDALFDLHEDVVRASQLASPKDALHDADHHLTLLRAYLRLALELKYSTAKQYEYAAQHTAEIGKLLGGWLKKA